MQQTIDKIFKQLSEYYPDTPFAVQYWTGDLCQYGNGGKPLFTLRIHHTSAVKRTLRNAALGFGEAYMDGDFDVDGDFQAFLKMQNAPIFDKIDVSLVEKIKFLFSVLTTQNSVQQVKKNVSHHYDLGNEFYHLWLDKSMTYTCAYFRTAHDTLEQAQNNKHEHLCRKLRLKPGHTLVDVGCGWGAMLFYAAVNYGAIATGYTISQEQYDWLQQEIRRRGLQDRVFVKLQDYREVTEKYDRFVSIGMAEQVGKKYIQTYFDSIHRMLKLGGVGVLHTIGSPTSKHTDPWFEKYIFPGGYLPTLAEMTEAMANLNLVPTDIEDLRLHYGETLDNWAQRFEKQVATIEKMYSPKFVRMWRLYLNEAAIVFRYGRGRLYQIAFTNGLVNDQPRTRGYLYYDEMPATSTAPSLNGTHHFANPSYYFENQRF